MSFKTKDGKYREKDLLDCIDLKNSNFNIPKIINDCCNTLRD